ncbi:MAG: hypothetical protein IE927_01010 [Rhodobacterales bacterium]|nr:hypothetical protein [Rhodobacterales bacterium]
MTRPPSNVTHFARDRRRPPKWSMGLPPRKPPPRRRWADPRRYLPAVAGAALAALVALPFAADALAAIARPADPQGCRVVFVTDGDTVTIHCPRTGTERARLLG